jgi:DNA processing protein
MSEFECIATYLIVNKVTTSQSMISWLPVLALAITEVDYSPQWLTQFFGIVRQLTEDRVINNEIASHLLQYSLWRDSAIGIVQELRESSIEILLWNSLFYPEKLKLVPDRPVILYLYGNQDLLVSMDLVTIVGTRSATQNGIAKCQQYVFEAVNCGYITVSGLALGIDTQVWNETLKLNGKTIAVVPQLTKSLIDDCREFGKDAQWLLVSEFPPQCEAFAKWQYIARNRILAGLSAMTIVIEAPVRSGTLHTADFALMYSRDLYISFPTIITDEAYGGVALAQSLFPGIYIQSLYDAFYLSNEQVGLDRYNNLVFALTGGRVDIRESDYRHLATLNLKRYIFDTCDNNLELFAKTMIKLVRFGIISERKGTVLFNFSGFNKWPKISL